MTFETYETSRTKGEKITLYHFYYVNGEQYHYTDAEKDVELSTVAGVFTPQPIQHSNVTSSGTLDKANLEIRMPRTAALAEAFRVYPPSEVVNVTIREVHKNDPAGEALVIWTGRVLSAEWNGNEIKFSCEPISTSLKRSGLRRHYQLGCPHQLYGPQCLASKLMATTPPIEIVEVAGATIRLPSGWIPAEWSPAKKVAAKFVGGMMVWELASGSGPITLKRTVLQVNGGTNVVISGIPTGLFSGSKVQMILGCNHQMSDCQDLHSNIKHYGGQPWIPLVSPFGYVNQYY